MHKIPCGACHRSILSESAMPQEPISYPMARLSAESETWCNKNMLQAQTRGENLGKERLGDE